jgi:hypothetical protein
MNVSDCIVNIFFRGAVIPAQAERQLATLDSRQHGNDKQPHSEVMTSHWKRVCSARFGAVPCRQCRRNRTFPNVTFFVSCELQIPLRKTTVLLEALTIRRQPESRTIALCRRGLKNSADHSSRMRLIPVPRSIIEAPSRILR